MFGADWGDTVAKNVAGNKITIVINRT